MTPSQIHSNDYIGIEITMAKVSTRKTVDPPHKITRGAVTLAIVAALISVILAAAFNASGLALLCDDVGKDAYHSCWKCQSPGWFNEPWRQVVGKSEGEQPTAQYWLWENTSAMKAPGFSNRFEISGLPSGPVFIVFDNNSLRMSNDETLPRKFTLYCGEAMYKSGTGEMFLRRDNFAQFIAVDTNHQNVFDLWFRVDHKDTKDSEGKTSIARMAARN
jgi:hypothetical protein